MRYLWSAMMLWAAMQCRVAFAAEVPLEMAVPDGWKMEYKSEKGVDCYVVTPSSESSGLLMLFKWPAPASAGEIPSLVRKMANNFAKATMKSGQYKLASARYELEPVVGGHCRGSHAGFRLKSGTSNLVQEIFMVSVDGQMWNGQFTGQPEHWPAALKMLTTLKKRG